MSAIVRACLKGATIKNTGVECNESMGPTSMLYAVPPGLIWHASDMVDFTAWLNTQIHAAQGARIYPLFGPEVPIRKITLSKESDVIPVQDDGTPIFVRYGTLTRSFGTTEAGICYAEALQSLNKSGYSIIEVDNANQLLMRKNEDGSYSGLRCTFMYSPSPDLPDFKTPGYINFQITFTPHEYVGFGVIFQGDATISDQVGLIDASITDATGSSVTKLKIGVSTTCGGQDLVAAIGAPLAVISDYVVKLKSSGAIQTITAAAIVGGHVELTGTFVSASTYTVAAAPAAVWLTNNVNGYEGVVSVDILIP